jgi:hypothetical protein
LAAVAAFALTGKKPLTHAINRLTDGGSLIRHERVLPGGLTAYTLSPAAAARLGLPRDRAELPSAAALDTAIAVQAFSHLGRHTRYPLSTGQAAELLSGAAPANVNFVVSDELGSPAVFRLMLAANRAPADTVRYLRTLIDQTERHPALAPWVAVKQLGFAVLACNRTHEVALEKAVSRARIRERAAVIVDVGPDAEHLAAVLKGRKGNG